MTLPLDHVVIVVADLQRAVADYTARGFTVTPGGAHPGRNTRNALVVFDDDSYLELITYEAPSPQERWWHVLTEEGEGLVDFALLPADVDAVVREARSRGLDGVKDPVDGGRLRPDGVRVAWRNARQSTHDLPFLCADVTPRNCRVPEGAARRHANGVTGIREVRVRVADLGATLARYRSFLGSEAVADEEVRLQGAKITFAQAPAGRSEGPCAVFFTPALAIGEAPAR